MPGGQALPGGRLNAFSLTPEDLVLVTDPEHPLFDPRALLPPDEALVLSIMAEGVRVPLVVWKDENGHALILDGRRRYIAAVEANKRLVADGRIPVKLPVMPPVRVEAERAFGLSVLLNELRQPDAMLARIAKLKRLLEYGYSEEDAAVRFGVSDQAVRNWLDIDSLHGEVKKLVEQGAISATAALGLRDEPLALQPQKARDLIAAGATSKDAVRDAVRGGGKRKKGQRAGQPKARLKRLYRIMAEGGRDLIDPSYANLLGWALGLDEIADDYLIGRVKGFAAVLKAEQALAERRAERKKRKGGKKDAGRTA